MDTKAKDDKKYGDEHNTFTWRLAVVILLLNLFAYGLVYWMLITSQRQYELKAKTASQNFAYLLEQNATDIFEKIDVVLRVARDELSRQVASGNVSAHIVNRRLRRTLRSIPELDRICVTGLASNDDCLCDGIKSPIIRTTISGETLDLREQSSRAPIITAPSYCEKTHKRMIYILRRYNKPNGAYAGIVGVAMDLGYFNLHFASVNIGEHGRIALLDKGQGVIAEYPYQEPMNEGGLQRKGFMQTFQHMLQKNPYKGSYLARSPQGGPAQMVSYQKAGNLPIFIHVGLSEDEYLADWRHEVKVGLLLVVTFSLLSFLFGFLVHRYWVARRTVLDVLTQKESLYRSFAEMSTDWFWGQDENFVFTQMSGALLDTYRTDSKQFIGKTRWEIAVDVPDEKMATHKAQVMAHQPFKDFEYSFYNLDGDKRTISASGVPIFDEEGNFKGYRGTGKDVTERRLYEESIHRMAQYDNLTGLPNRVLFNNRVEMAMTLAKREGKKFALLYFDLDKFKPVNDNYGHDAGDNLLQQVARRVSLELRDSDTVARLGGDEFAILQMGVGDLKAVEEVATRIIATLTAPFAVSGVEEEVRIGASIGIAIFPDDASTKQRLIKVADTAMYEAKKVRNCYRMYSNSESFGASNNGGEKQE